MENRDLQRAKLHSEVWKIANEIRGSMNVWDSKDYILGFIFYRYLSENLKMFINVEMAKIDTEDEKPFKGKYEDFNFDINDEASYEIKYDVMGNLSYFIEPNNLYENILKSSNDENLNEKLANAFAQIEDSFKEYDQIKANVNIELEDLSGIFKSINLNNDKLGNSVVERNRVLRKILNGIANFPLNDINESKIDILGDIYEFLMSKIAAESGSTGGQFFTPQEVGELLANIVLIDFNSKDKRQKQNIKNAYDPTCGSGSLLLKLVKLLKNSSSVVDKFYGQEIEANAYNMGRMNMILHNISRQKFNIKWGDTLKDPKHIDVKFEAIVSNPPFSQTFDTKNNPELETDERFINWPLPNEKKRGDFAFIIHSLYSLEKNGTMAIVEFPGILERDRKEQAIREKLVKENMIEAIIQLPSNMFFGTSTSTIIIVFRKNKLDSDVLFINAANEFVKEGKNNKLSPENIQNIITLLKERKDIEGISKLVTKKEIIKRNYLLSVNTYIPKVDNSEKIDIKKLNAQLEELATNIQTLRNEISDIVKELEDE
ncbi:type I restriction-modification system subunit M [Mycoplasma sp. M5725]|uniref:site-specific DNA-methyltransferase (adenine-specific) n=1 Tax=Mycoplasma phocimorsus TaxID=3045839 RepID=A0AAJ1UZU3_9MOLU|nr:type I restriction-modification system subunit M [Mycoplasma phocimorsus]MDJ1646078.1 type I restriction-modification system subunit M [Mycoplasma phocimorsus]MDJ1646383.1 type I restriction-modification system subunit M [Mycoplasma phocimorsus]MDJ1649085.1 type I restriction-modification system subunit M [Mycoplasma phocimorsus]